MREKAAALHRAKQIADKVRKLVQSQQKQEKIAGHKVRGSVLGAAQEEQQKASDMSAQDELLAQKLQDEQAQRTMQHLIETERGEQRKAFEQERESTHSLLDSVRKKLQLEQSNIVKKVQSDTSAAVKKVEKDLSQTSLAQTIEDVVKKKLSKRLNELKTEGEKTVHDVTAQVDALNHRVRRLRREQTRMKMQEASMEQNMQRVRESHESHDLGESAGTGASMATELEKMRLEQMMAQMNPMQQQMRQQVDPQMSEEHREFLRMKDEMTEMREQNMLLQEQVRNQMSVQSVGPAGPVGPVELNAIRPRYSHSDLKTYFKKRRNTNADLLKKRVLAEQNRLRALTEKLKDAESEPDSAEELGEPEMLVQVSEGADDVESVTALPLYHQRSEEARVHSEDLRQRANEAALASQNFGE